MSESTAAPAPAPEINPATASDAEFQAAVEQIESQPEPEASPEPEQPAGEPAAPKMVPLAALHEARAETRRERDERLRSEAVMNDRLTKIQETLAARNQPPAPEIPDFNADPAAHLDQRLREQEQWREQQQRSQTVQSQERHLASTYSAAAQKFAAATPDFGPAYNHAVGHMAKLAEITGIPAQIMEREIVVNALNAGRDPAQAIYDTARAMGYAPKPAEQPLAAQLRGQAATASVGGGGSPGGTANTSAEALLQGGLKEIGKMSDADFEKVLAGIR